MLDTDGATVAASGSSVMIIRNANPFRATYFYHLLPINIRIFILRNNPKEGRSPQLRAAVRPRSATFIHFYVDPPLTRARRNRAGAPSARACSSVFTVPRVCAAAYVCASALASTSPDDVIWFVYVYPRAFPRFPRCGPLSCESAINKLYYAARIRVAKVFRRGRRAWLPAAFSVEQPSIPDTVVSPNLSSIFNLFLLYFFVNSMLWHHNSILF